MPVAMLLTLVCVSLTGVLAPVVIGQVDSTQESLQRMRALHAAQTGLDVGVAGIRSAYSGSATSGARGALPCDDVRGSGGAEALSTYTLTIAYYAVAPGTAGAAAMSCAAARGGPGVPRYALLTAVGATTGRSAATRRLRGVYPLRVSAAAAAAPTPTASATAAPAPTTTYGPHNDISIQPRMIWAWSPAANSTDLCVDAGASRPAANSRPRFQVCDGLDHETAGYKQFWYYREDLTLATVGSLLSSQPMCLDAGATPAAGQDPTMQPCLSPPTARQRWFYTSTANFELGNAAGTAVTGLCLNVHSPGDPGSRLVLGTSCHSSAYDTRQTFSFSTKTGPGRSYSRRSDCTDEAGYACTLRQVVNFANPSRCLDRYSSFMANMECVQDPDPDDIRWTQLWRVPTPADGTAGVTGPLVAVNGSGATYCLTSPSSTDMPTLQSCTPRSARADQRFTVYANTGNSYSMYRVLDASGRCMTHPNDHRNGVDANFFWNQANWNWKIRMDSCVNSRNSDTDTEWNYASVVDRQKWMAPAVLPTRLPPAPSASPTRTATAAPTVAASVVPTATTVVPAPTPAAGAEPLQQLVELP
ncbi:hypothetical protein GCM10010124_35400 [Pilimelia terevasa]|uniref:Ricin B lectin domain-containing protein n=2 Tax=Pilimelia terevasa TaxID=53372 RepID=A0A8J3FL89_9ACTN|nr:hypothetical protein GCM10010124_35400 [Pilimelia terevasa]